MTTGSDFYENRSLRELVSADALYLWLPTCDFYSIVFGRDFDRFDFGWDLAMSVMFCPQKVGSRTPNVS